MCRKEVWFWWHFCRKKRVYTKQWIMFMRLLSNSRIHEEDISRSVCILCNEAMEDRTAHVSFQCNRTREKFENEMQLLQLAMSPAMWMQFDALDRTGKTVFIASGMNSMYLAEWDHICIQVLSLVKCAYNQILNTIDNM